MLRSLSQSETGGAWLGRAVAGEKVVGERRELTAAARGGLAISARLRKGLNGDFRRGDDDQELLPGELGLRAALREKGETNRKGLAAMGQLIPERQYNPFQDFNDRRVVASVIWRRDVIVGIVVIRRRDGWSAFLDVPEEAQRRLACGVNRDSVLKLWSLLRMVVQWGLRDLHFEEIRGFSLDPRQNGAEPAQCGCLRAFGGDFVGVDIGEFETPDLKRLN